MKFLKIFLFLMLTGSLLFGQKKYKKLSPKAKFKLAEEYFARKKYKRAWKIYDMLVEDDAYNSHYNYKAGVSIVLAGAADISATQYFEYAVENISDKFKSTSYKEKNAPIQAWLYLAKLYHQNYQFDKALKVLKKFKPSNGKERKEKNMLKIWCTNANNAVAKPINCFITRLPKGINSENDDYSPLVSLNEAIFVFSAKRSDTKGKGTNKGGKFKSDIYTIDLKNGYMEKPTNKIAVNTTDNESAVAISGDGKMMIVQKEKEKGTLYVSFLENMKWTTPKKLGANVNTSSEEKGACFSADGKTIYFSSNRPGGRGGFDIYYVKADSKGKLSTAKRLEGEVNTADDEIYPFITPDEKLYFSSNGKLSIGGFDIMVAEKENGKYSKVKNAGYPLNSTHDETGYSELPNGKEGFYTSFEPQSTNSDIFQIHYNSKQAKKYSLLWGDIQSAAGKEVKNYDLQLLKGSNAKSNPPLRLGSEFCRIVPNDDVYYLYSNAPEHLPYVRKIDLAANNDFAEININIRPELIKEAIFEYEFDINNLSATDELELKAFARANQNNLYYTLNADTSSSYYNSALYKLKKDYKINVEGKTHTDYQTNPKLLVTNRKTKSYLNNYTVRMLWNKKEFHKEGEETIDQIVRDINRSVHTRVAITFYEINSTYYENALAIKQALISKGIDKNRIEFNYTNNVPEKYDFKIPVKTTVEHNPVYMNVSSDATMKLSEIKFEPNRISTNKYDNELKILSEYLKRNPDKGITLGYRSLVSEDGFNVSIARINFIKEHLKKLGIKEKSIRTKTMTEATQNTIIVTFKGENTKGIEVPYYYDDNYTVISEISQYQLPSSHFDKINFIKYFNILMPNKFFVYTCGSFKNKQLADQFKMEIQTEGLVNSSVIRKYGLDHYLRTMSPLKNKPKEYTIELFSSKKKINKDLFKTLGLVGIYYNEKTKIYKYTFGQFKHPKQAASNLQYVISKGYPSAFITDFMNYSGYTYQ